MHSNNQPFKWVRIPEDTMNLYDNYDKFVVKKKRNLFSWNYRESIGLSVRNSLGKINSTL